MFCIKSKQSNSSVDFKFLEFCSTVSWTTCKTSLLEFSWLCYNFLGGVGGGGMGVKWLYNKPQLVFGAIHCINVWNE